MSQEKIVQHVALSRRIAIIQALLYFSVVVVIGVFYILLNIQMTREQLRFVLITYSWETIIACGLTMILAEKWVRPIVKYIQSLNTDVKRNTFEIKKIYSLAIHYPLKVGTMSALVVFIAFMIGLVQVIVFVQANTVQVVQGLIIAFVTSFGLGITSILVYERLMASDVAKLCEMNFSSRIVLPIQAKLIMVSVYLVLLCIVFIASAQFKNFSIKFDQFANKRGLYELHLVRASITAQYREQFDYKNMRENLMSAVEIAPSRMLFAVDLSELNILPLTKNLNISDVKNIISRHRNKMQASKQGFVVDLTADRYITFIEGMAQDWRLVMLEPRHWQFAGFNPLAGATLGTMFLACALAAVLSFFMAGNIRRPVHSLSELAERVTAGKLSSSLGYASTDELGSLSVSLHRMVATLAESIKRLRIMAGQLGVATVEIASSVDENEKISDQQVTELGTTLETLDKLRQSGQQVFEESRQVQEIVENATLTILTLSEKSGEIGQMSATINEISEQINMLSLNASIEAARAGEQGKGFAVIADEIRELADRTNQFTVVISKLIDDIQSSVRNTILSTEKMVSGVRHISLSVEQQSQGTKQIVESIEHMNQGFRQTAISGQEVGVAVINLKDMAEEIRKFIEKFDLNGKNEQPVVSNIRIGGEDIGTS